eukprot:932141_1
MFSWDEHVDKDVDMGYYLHLQMTEEQIRTIHDQSPPKTKSIGFPTAISLPFEQNRQWLVKTKWNEKQQISKTNAFVMAEQFENIYMGFVQEAINRNYCYNSFGVCTAKERTRIRSRNKA